MAARDQSNLEAELQELKAALQDKEDLLMKTAEFGKTLLDANQELERQIEEIAMTHSEKIEASLWRTSFSIICLVPGCLFNIDKVYNFL